MDPVKIVLVCIVTIVYVAWVIHTSKTDTPITAERKAQLSYKIITYGFPVVIFWVWCLGAYTIWVADNTVSAISASVGVCFLLVVLEASRRNTFSESVE